MPQIWNDKTIKIKYDPQYVKQRFTLNAIGPEPWTTIAETTLTHTDDDTIYVSGDTGNDTTGDGTSALPYATEVKGISECDIDHNYVVILDSADYVEDYTGVTNEYWMGTFAAVGETPRRSRRTLSFTPANSNSIFVAKTGDDGDAGTEAAPKLTIAGAAAACDGTHQKVVILDSETYEEAGFEFTGNFKGIYSAVGCTPEIQTQKNVAYYSATKDVDSTLVSSDTLYGGQADSCLLQNGNIFLIHRTAAVANEWKARFKVVNKAGTAILAEQNFPFTPRSQYGSRIMSVNCATLADGNVIVAYCNYDDLGTVQYYGCYAVINPTTGATVISETVFESDAGSTPCIYPSVCVLANGDIFLSWSNSAAGAGVGYYLVLNSSYATIKSKTSYCASNAYNRACVALIDGNILIAFDDYTRYATYLDASYVVVSGTDYTTVVHAKQTVPEAAMRGICQLANGMMFLATTHWNVTSYTDIIVFEYATYSSIVSWTAASAAYWFYGVTLLADDTVYLYGGALNTNAYFQVWDMTHYAIKVSVDTILEGIILSPLETDYLGKFIYCNSADLDIYNCTIEEAETTTSTLDYCQAISSNHEVNLYNSILRDCDIGVVSASALCEFINSQFFRITDGYAVDIDGAAASLDDILFDHCDFFACYGGIHLENNNGDNETIKNCIFHDNAVKAIDAETEVTYSNSICTDSVTGAAEGSSVRHANPLYKNEGYIDPDDTDLTLKNSDVGDGITSPGITLGDDGKNAGAIDDIYPGSGVTWSEIEITKPEVLPITREYAGAVNLQLASGDYESYFDGRSEMLKFKWKGISNDDYDELDKVLDCDSNELLIYFEPDTNPAIYYAFTLLREAVSAGNSYYLLDSVGKEDVEVSVARKYERET